MTSDDLLKRCETCQGRGYVLPRSRVYLLGVEPPSTEWCDECNGKGRILTESALAIIDLVQSMVWSGFEGYLDTKGHRRGITPLFDKAN